MSEKSLRQQAKEAYIRLIEEGHSIGPREFSRLSGQLLGQHIPYETIRDWYKADQWSAGVKLDSFDASKELKETRMFLDIARNGIMLLDEETSTQAISQFALMYRKMLRKLPRVLWPVVEEEIIDIRDRLISVTKNRKDRARPAVLSTIAGVWSDLQEYVLPDIAEVNEDAVIPADSLILGQRKH